MKYKSKLKLTALVTAIAILSNNIAVSVPVSRYVFNEINVSAADEPGTDGSNTDASGSGADAAGDNEQTPDVTNDNDSNDTDNSDNAASNEASDDTAEPDNSDVSADPDSSDNADASDDSTDEDKPVENNDIIINTAEELVKYSQDYYAEPSKYHNTNVTIAATIGNFSNLDGFVSIGTPEYPFDAQLIITSSTDFSIALDEPFFAYIYDSASIVNSLKETTSVTISGTAKEDSALFAENVLHKELNDKAAEWKVNIGSYVEGGISVITPFSCVIGTLKENAAVDLEVNNSTGLNASVEGSGNVGLACGKMEAGSKLTVTVSGDSSYNVTSTGANAGGMVGAMESSTFTLENEFNGTGTITAAGYAGGLVGYAKNSEVSFEGTAKVSGTIIGETATGGVFGYYKNEKTEDETFDISRYNVNCTLNGANSGGIFGRLENSGNMTISKNESETADIKANRGSDEKKIYGGFIGVYSSDDTSNTLIMSKISANVNNSADSAEYFGGFIGKVDDNSYIRFEEVSVTASNCRRAGTSFGGLVGTVNNAFIDAYKITVNINGSYGYGDFYGGGVIGNMSSGILRLSGITDLTGTNAVSGGQIVGTRGDKALIYALNDWQLNRGNASDFDDIGTWGEVLRLSSSSAFNESSILNVDMDKHTVTVKSAKTTVGSLADFAVLALNIQMNDGVSSDSTLIFESASTTSENLLNSDITLNCNIDLAGTGITGLTRDNGTNSPYTGTFDGSGHTVTLATGEPYGYRGGTSLTADDTSEGNGRIYRHYYNGLFAQTGSGVTFKDLTLSGVISVQYTDGQNNYYIGGLSALHSGDFMADGLIINETISIIGTAVNYCLAGGIVGQIYNDTNPVAAIKNSTVSPIINCTGSSSKYVCGGALGEIGKNNTFSLTVDNVILGAEVTSTSSAYDKKVGGFIGNISNYNAASSGRTIAITNMTVNGAKVTTQFGGALLGEAWNNTDVTFGSDTESGITVKSAKVTQESDGSSNDKSFAGFVTNATGYWKVNDINIEAITVNGSTASSFGMLVNRGIYKYDNLSFGLYLEFEKENAYKITSADITLNANTIYDDIIATCSGSISDDDKDLILQNGKNAVVSIHTSGDKVIMDGKNCNTYQNQTSVKKVNPYSRYYYNLDVIRDKALEERTPAEKLMLWSLDNYAYGNVKNYFNNSYIRTIPAGSYDMTGYSYYPIDMPSSMTIVSGATFIFCNDKIESGENGTGNSDAMARKTIGEMSQHYLMHCGLFRNSGGVITAKNVTFSGSVGADSDYSGVLFCGTVMGSVNNTASINLDGVVLDGIKINGTDSDYTPLLINKTDSYSNFQFSNISTTNYEADAVAATSLLGDVGNADGNSKDIKLTFSGLTLDGRKADITDSDANTALTGAYNTNKSVFSKAILLNSFKYKAGSNCTGTYNFRLEEDWNYTQPKHNVAYGMEISNSAEYDGLQEKYLKSETFTDPTRSDADSKFDFGGGFLPYVAVSYNDEKNYHEIKVNQSNSVDLDKGCGTYNDPYIISSGKQLELIDKILNSGLTDSDEGIIINYTENNYSAWCSSKNSHNVLTWSGSSFKNEDGSTSKITLSNIQNSLSTAYYLINGNVTISSADFVGIGKTIPFKGVILGDGDGENIKTITNETVKPLIYQSMGSVVKNIAIKVTSDFSKSLTSDANSNYETDGGKAEFYGGVIGIVNGGDNIIDNVSVTFDKAGTINIKTGTNYGNKAVGGYIGVVRYGGVIFRNMDKAENHAGITSSMNSMFKNSDDFKDNANKVLLYCNPIIGRVIDGYAVNETSSFNGAEANVTMKNGIKNYSIADIKTDADRISIADSTIKVNDAQQLYLLGCIAMSGAGSSDTSGNYPLYSNKGKFSYGTNKMVRHAEYSDIGTDNTADKTTDFSLAKSDNYSRNSVPYIIYKYTESDEKGTYAAKSLTYRNSVFSLELTNGTYELPDGFRGIGALNSSDSDMIMHIKDLNGNGSTIKLNMNFYKYYSNYDIYYNLNSDGNNVNSKRFLTGLGLFNNLVQKGDGSIFDFTLSGNVSSDYFDNHDGKKTESTYKSAYFSCAGGLAGVGSDLSIENVKIKDLSSSAQYIAGGLIGYLSGSADISNCSVNDFSAENGLFSGSIAAYTICSSITVDKITINNLSAKSNKSFDVKEYERDCGIGSLIGTVSNNNNEAKAEISNITLDGVTLDTNSSYVFVGGLVGCCGTKTTYKLTLTVDNIKLNDLKTNISNGYNQKIVYSGGMFGVLKQSIKNAYISNVQIGDEKPCTIYGRNSVGGITGLLLCPTTVDNFSISNSIIRADNVSEAVGGIFGKVECVSSNLMQVKITNSKVSDCQIYRNGAGQVGGLIGYSCNSNGSKVVNIYGYNIALDKVPITDVNGKSIANLAIAGDICGVLHKNNNLRLVGVSYKKADGEIHVNKDIGTKNGTSFIIYADYNGSSFDDVSANKSASSVNSANNVADMGAFPYVTVNPQKVIAKTADSSQFLTGDGVDKSAIDAIIADTSRYNNITADKTTFAKYEESKRLLFNEKTNSSIPDDIPILLINDSNYRNITEMLNSYIHILTNDTTISYSKNADSSIYKVEITPMQLSNGVFEAKNDSDKKTLLYENGYFKMGNDYDSNNKSQFTLIDIQYLDPAGTSEIAYHLYIPVYVEKMLNFDFRAAALSGTVYNTTSYTDGDPVLENYGTPVTSHITYFYKRTAEEWQGVINSGEDMLTSYGKSVLMESNKGLPPGTRFVLVDRNNYSKAYYSSVDDAVSEVIFNSKTAYKLDFSKFSTADDTGFEPVTFCDLLNKAADITAAADTDGMLVKCTGDTSKAVFKIGNDYYRKKTDSDTDTSNLFKVTLEPQTGMTDDNDILKLEEDYYISFFTDADNTQPMRNIIIQCDSRLGDTNMTPSHLDNSGAANSMVHMMLGNLYDQTFTFKTNGSEVINDNNRSISAEMKTVISLKAEDASETAGYLNYDSIHLYHAFLIEATRTDESGTEKGIKGNPSVSGTYKMGTDAYQINLSNTDSVITITGGSDLDIKEKLLQGSVTISCSDLEITYSDGESIIAQFPERKNQDEQYGVTLAASSNLAYVSDNIGQSKMTENRNDSNGKSYYRENIEAATLSYNLPTNSPNEMVKLGVNGLDTNDKITAVGYYNVLNLTEAVVDKAKKVQFTLSLYQKADDGSYTAVAIGDYLENITLYDKNNSAKAPEKTGESYDFIFDKDSELKYEAGSFEIFSSYSVITGGDFESGGKLYSNYKVQLTAQLLDENGDPIENSGCSDYIIYTNAKINSQMMSVG